ncbi:type IV secretory system conjugative DNA transfer family protein [Micromonospora sp. KC721]|uniref:type IV secretory system conjugative DNA transfer family protein n=1 Tax=Micromonospora sp. KC721 TaxID=2530380 RepID=UPI0010456D4A|nr:type IV secretory system conjugative DNA transfer family protein [Micromonospora sp. KC721]TDB80174.1 ATP-binding protein [Micromonospora sp. KC721]
MSTRTVSEIRADRAAKFGRALTALLAVTAYAVSWIIKRSWRRLFPFYWVLAELVVASVAGPLGVSWQTVAILALAIAATAARWRARSRAVRAWRAAVAVVLGGSAVATVAAGGPAALAAHPTATIAVPTLLGAVLGWPWWYHLRQRPPQPEPEPTPVMVDAPVPVVDPLTAHWQQRWQHEVVAEGVCAGTTLVKADSPRPGVTEALVRLAPGTKPGPLFKSGTDVEVALDLNEGTVGWRSTGKTAWLRVILVEQSHIADGVPWTGPTYANGRCELARFTDGSPGQWVFSRPNFGVLGGLVVGSSGSGKTRALGVLIANLLEGRFQVVIGDPQNGQSLPAWKNTVEYHAGVEATILLLRRFHAEVMRRSQLLADAGVDTYDEHDPRVQALGLGKLMVVVDECQLVLIPNTPLVPLVEQTAETMRKTGAGLVLATQLPQMKSLGGSVRLRDAQVAGNALILRLSNRGSGTTILPDDFVGDPFAIEREIDGKTTAGMGYLRHSNRVGMLCRVPHLDEAAVAAASPRVPVRWTVPPIDPNTPIKAPSGTTAARPATTGSGSAVDRLRAAFGGGRKATTVVEQVTPQTSAEWVLACLRRGPASAQALLDRPDCPVNQAQLYALLTKLKDADRITPPAQRGGPFTIAG